MAKKIRFEPLILWEDDHYQVVDKPPFLSTLADRNDRQNILSLAKSMHEGAHVCHRLDKNTSGVLIVAKDDAAYRHMSIQFENRTIEKVYHTVADGVHNFKGYEVSDNILKLANGTVRVDKKGKEARTTLNTLKAFRDHTLIECRPISGRMHQIRIHLAEKNAPISGDILYGGKPFYLSSVKKRYHLKKGDEEQPLIRRLALHARSISFHTMEGHRQTVEAAYPKDFRVLLEQLEKNT